MAAVEFRCPHTKLNASRDEKRAKRRELMEVPANVEWKPVQDVRMGDNGVLEVFDVGTYYALVKCPVCKDEKKVVTDKKVK